MSDYVFGKNQPPHRRWPVAWYNPWVLLRSLREMLATDDQIRNLDRREMYSSTLELIQVAETERDDDFWWDFVSDTGDGGNAAYAVARQMQIPLLNKKVREGLVGDIPDTLPMGELLVLGGDLAYPGASVEEYQYRLAEMWTASGQQERPAQEAAAQLRPSLAIPQNHDWFDNISSFNLYFVDRREKEPEQGFSIKSAETQVEVTPLSTRKLQKQSYFAARLPNNWVILGLDFALVGDIDRKQHIAFRNLFNGSPGCEPQITPEDNIILLYPEPYWTRDLGDHAREGYPKRYQRLEAFIRDKNGKIRLRIAGDIHHYAREFSSAGQSGADDMLITAGGGGAFLHPTHTNNTKADKVRCHREEPFAMSDDLKSRIRLGVDSKGDAEVAKVYDRHELYPTAAQSKSLLWRSVFSFFKPAESLCSQLRDKREDFWKYLRLSICQGNILFAVLLGVIFAFAVVTSSWIPGILLLAIYAGISGEGGMGFKILGAFVGALVLGIAEAIASGLCISSWNMCGLIFAWVGAALLGIVIGGLITGIYFWICSARGYLPNNAFSHLGHEGYKSFLRFRIDREGNLHGYLWGTNHVPSFWVKNPAADYPLWVEADHCVKADWEIKDTFILRK
ncbi:ABC transporter permease [Cellvibrio japonicus]|uniref:Uncharacterized protein n=1 Tax=Cellvibrio japonicus (strain Ueda107) TaxID=498211 RepID=B3PJI1_CELJU|nr:MFS transporter [Cellvibrio japonicus]ACE85976.1 hypothetical protein CJA_0587 [Cellvibrio japonicus Ueda107]QEI11268.1 MFS transporter [Cellvibrio japonicus]QEI14842.1 MFS transporter [Cellvibrio japonicus]QEI18422.1 MFS transporter [Cellvibrio japonicus]